MAGRTISAYTDEETARLAEQIARLEHRKISQIAAEAIALYVRLPREAHSSLREMQADGDPAHRLLLVQRLSRAIIRVAYDASLDRIALGASETIGKEPKDEDEIVAESVRLTAGANASAPPRNAGRASEREGRRHAS